LILVKILTAEFLTYFILFRECLETPVRSTLH